ncbi:CUE domain-containing protein 1-like isoform X1 [Acipenser ruthenus]|uniref:CUE domain-containing protein 1-like isoform X1 n=1 Tax=Acipenser ruthenus TaxID=7906 RepID=UPI0027417DCA|nr:CUE domain-containing protein 1-like isoform X1 [Acipenser ruthenus]XP_058853851.1 CUE domain-containing protein 1-like isoform X1 [Acipenser ruthenus]
MTSLFRRSSSRGGSAGSNDGAPGNGSSAAPQDLNNSRPAARPVRRLEFNQAMEDFKIMFPSVDSDVIECVLRANSGAVEATINQLLQMNMDGYDDSDDSDDSIPPEILERTLEPDSSDEEPPPVYSPPAYDMHIYDRKYPEAPPIPPPRYGQEEAGHATALSSYSYMFDAQPPAGPRPARRYRDWNPPLLGSLPDDFLRILPQQRGSVQNSQSSQPQVPGAGSTVTAAARGGAQASQGVATEQERKLKQYLDDERIALFLQNEEFMRELQRNREFLLALEKDRLKYESKKSKPSHTSASLENSTAGDHSAPGPVETCSTVSDDAMFRDKLKHMGKSTRKKLFEIARTFSEKTKMRKPKRKTLLKHQALGTAASTTNLLDDVEGNSCDDDVQGRRVPAHEEEEEEEEGRREPPS